MYLNKKCKQIEGTEIIELERDVYKYNTIITNTKIVPLEFHGPMDQQRDINLNMIAFHFK